MLEDITITCPCGADFIYDIETQQYHQSKGYQQPKYCLACREKRRAEKQAPRQLTTIICSKCGKEDTVSFVPRDITKVMCHECYKPTARMNFDK